MINFSGYNENVVTFAVDDSTVVMGTPVKMTGSKTIGACEDGDNMAGVAVNVRNGYAAVQLTGYIEMPTDDTFTPGYNTICAADGGKIKSSDTGREYLVASYENGIAGIIL